MDRLRFKARGAMPALLSSNSNVQHHVELTALFNQEKEGNNNNDDDDEVNVWNVAVQCLALPQYRRNVFLSLCVSAGLRSPDPRARQALLEYLTGKAVEPVLRALWEEDVAVLIEQYARDDRVISHLLCTADVLVRNGCFDQVVKDATEVRKACWNSFAGSSLIPVLSVGIDLMCGLFRFGDYSRSLHLLVTSVLHHRYPRVRQHCSLQLQLQFASINELCPDVKLREEIGILLVQGCNSEESVAPAVAKLLKFEMKQTHVGDGDDDDEEI
jgi:hypothetical protein